MDKYINFDVDSAEIIEDENELDSQFATARILAFSSGKNRHDMIVSEEVLISTAKSLNNVPLLYNFDSMFGKADFNTHTDPEKSLIAGFVVPNSQEFIRLSDGTGRLGVFVTAKIWKKYAPQVMKIFQQRSVKPVSVEMELTEFEQLLDGLIDMKNFTYFGICILGNLVVEASPGANIEMLSFSVDENETVKNAYRLEFSKQTKPQHKSRYSEIDFSIPETIKNNANRGLEMAKQNGRSGAVYMAIGNHLSKSDKISSEKARYINKNISIKRESELEFMLMGGEESIQWSKVIVDQMDEKDSKMISYFGELENTKKEVKNSMDKTKDEEIKEETMAVEPVEEVEKEQDMAVDSEKDEKKETVAEEKKESPADEEKETPEEEKSESEDEQKAEKKAGVEKKMSLDAYLDVSAVMGFLTKETEDNKEIADEYASGQLEDGKLVAAMYAQMCKMSDNLEKYAAENEELKKFKADIEKERFSVKVESFMQEMSGELPTEEFAKAKEDSANFSMDSIDEWKNKVKVTAFNFSRTGKEKKKQDFVSIAMPFVGNNQSNSGETKSPWTRK